MITRLFLLSVMLCVAPFQGAFAQGFAGLGSNTAGFKEVVPGRVISFPADYGPHPDYRIEWWYLTANLTAENGEEIGIQWTLFRQATRPGQPTGNWSDHEFWMAHAAVTTEKHHVAAEKFARGGTGQAGALAAPFQAWLDDWHLGADSQAPSSPWLASAHSEGFDYELALVEKGSEVLQGDQGFSIKSNGGHASYYFSHPFLEATGFVDIKGERFQVKGEAWLDREWSSQPLSANQEGWDWFSIKLNDGQRLMAFALRDKSGPSFHSGTWIAANGDTFPLAADDIELSPLRHTSVAGRQVPTRWQLSVKSRQISLTVEALNDQSWMPTSIAYWEGPVTVSGSHKGRGYLEMTGYAPASK